MSRLLAALSASAVLATAVSAQCFESSFGTSIGGGDDAAFPSSTTALPMNITFPMGGTFASYTHITVNTNGCAFLWNAATGVVGATATGYSTTPSTQLTNIRGAAGGAPRIAPFWRDLNMVAGNNGAVWLNNTIPGKCVVTWANAVQFGTTSPIFTVQAQLFSDGSVQFFYNGTAASTGAFVVGVSQGGAIAAVPSVNLSAGGNSGTTQLLFEQFAASTFDLQTTGLTFAQNVGGGYDQAAAPCVPASNSNYGAGCYQILDSFYQTFATAALASPALSNTAITLTPSGGGYTATNGGSLLAVGSVQAVPQIVAVGDDVEQTVPFTVGSFPGSTGLSICSNGFVSLAAGNSTTFNVSSALLLNDPQTSFRSAHDMNPNAVGSGQIKYEESAAVALVTWDGVYDFGGTTAADANTIQIQLYPSGVVVIAWGTLSTLGASGIGYVVGYSPGGPSPNPGSINLATALPVTTSPLNVQAMSLSATPPPVSTGGSGTLMTYAINDIPLACPSPLPVFHFGIIMLSTGQDLAGTDLLTGYGIDAPGCRLHITSLDATISFVDTVASQTAQFQVPAGVPAGFQFYAQAAALVCANTLPNGLNNAGIAVSNGVMSTVQPF